MVLHSRHLSCLCVCVDLAFLCLIILSYYILVLFYVLSSFTSSWFIIWMILQTLWLWSKNYKLWVIVRCGNNKKGSKCIVHRQDHHVSWNKKLYVRKLQKRQDRILKTLGFMFGWCDLSVSVTDGQDVTLQQCY